MSCRLAILWPILIALTGAGCTEPSVRNRPRQIILITVDTLRADRLGCYGYDRDTSPHIDSFAARSSLYSQASCQAPWTTASFASLFTGRTRTEALAPGDRVHPDLPHLAEILRDQGLHTVGVIANPTVNRSRGFARGFDRFVELARQPEDRPSEEELARTRGGWWKRRAKVRGEEVNEAVIPILQDLAEQDFFLWVLYLDPHTPYLLHPPGFYRGEPPMEQTVEPGEPVVLPPAPARAFDKDGRVRYVLPTRPGSPEDQPRDPLAIRDAVRYYYEGEVRYVDEQVGILLEELRRLKLTDRGLVIVTADHGQSLYDYQNYFGHGGFAFEPEARVPLIIHWPASEPSRIHEPVALADLYPTILEFVGTEASGPLHGVPLTPEGRGGSDSILIETQEHRFRALRKGDYKLIHRTDGREPRLGLYHLREDPAERNDRSASEPERTARLLAELESRMAVLTPAPEDLPPPDLDTDTRERIRALGYVD